MSNLRRKEPAQFDFKSAIGRLEELLYAEELLNTIYSERGPYRDGKIDDKTWDRVRDYFNFDDSE